MISGMNYAPSSKPRPVCSPGEFPFAFVGLDHGHAYGMTAGLVEAGGHPAVLFEPDDEKVAEYLRRYPDTRRARSLDDVLSDPDVRLVCSASVPNERTQIGVATLQGGKHFFSDKPPFTSRKQLDEARRVTAETGRIWAIYYSERLHNEAAVYAGELVATGAIGTVLNVVGLGPHRLNLPSRPPWFLEKERYGGILVDLGSHQIEQFLAFAGATDGRVIHSTIGNRAHPEAPELEDFGDVVLMSNNGVTGYSRVDWFTPDGLSTWGDGRLVVAGTEGYLELRKYVDPARSSDSDHVYLVDGTGEHYLNVHGQVGFPFFGALILDCLSGSRTAMDQTYAFRVAELALEAEEQAVRVDG
ncbi:MAG: Gfo/Idh/MocA family protein [Alkalispirochaeta sp.]